MAPCGHSSLQGGAVLLPVLSGIRVRCNEARIGLLDRSLSLLLRGHPAGSLEGPRIYAWCARRHGPHPYTPSRTMIVQEHAPDRGLSVEAYTVVLFRWAWREVRSAPAEFDHVGSAGASVAIWAALESLMLTPASARLSSGWLRRNRVVAAEKPDIKSPLGASNSNRSSCFPSCSKVTSTLILLHSRHYAGSAGAGGRSPVASFGEGPRPKLRCATRRNANSQPGSWH
jgi:hypothetical protein